MIEEIDVILEEIDKLIEKENLTYENVSKKTFDICATTFSHHPQYDVRSMYLGVALGMKAYSKVIEKYTEDKNLPTIADAYDAHKARENQLEMEAHLVDLENAHIKQDALLKALPNNTTEIPQ